MPKAEKVPLGPDQMGDLAKMLCEKWSMSKDARSTQVDGMLERWEKNYAGTPQQEVRSIPFYRASNFMPQLVRMHTDILSARVLGIIFGTRPFWVPKTALNVAIPHQWTEALQEWINYISDTELDWFETVDCMVHRAFSEGSVVMKARWNEETQSEFLGNGQFSDEQVSCLRWEALPFRDFWPYPITAPCIERAEICFHRIRLTERGVKERVTQGKWDKKAADLMFPQEREAQMGEWQSSGIMVTPDVDYPYTAIEAWLDYPVGGSPRPICCVFNPLIGGANAVLACYYNFYPKGKKPFVDLKPIPRKDFFYGYSVPEILEQSQEEQAQIHNARRDANVIANIPGWKRKRYADVPNPSDNWAPGKVFDLDDMADLEPLQFGIKYDSMIDEEQFIMSLAERYVGISPAMQGYGSGQSAGKRGVYATGATLALLAEGNQRLDIYLRRLRYPFHRIGRMTFECYRLFRPNGPEFAAYGEKGESLRQVFRIKEPAGSSGIFFDIGASDAGANRETDRQNLLLMAQTMASYYTQIWQAVGTLAQVPEGSPVKETLLMVLDGARDLANRLLFAFDVPDRDRILPDLRKLFGSDQGGLQGLEGAIQPADLQSLLAGITAGEEGSAQVPGNGAGGY